jgi:hypothetical protein
MLAAMKRTPSLVVVVVAVLASSSALALAAAPARADGFLAVTGGAMFPLGDDDWNDLIEASPTIALRGGGGKKLTGRTRLMFEVGFELTPLSNELDDNAVLELDLTRYRAVAGVRYEQLVERGFFVAARAGIGIDHLRGESSSPLVPTGTTDSDTGLALEVGVGPWFSFGQFSIGFELALPISIHDSDEYDFRSIDLALLGGLRFRL